MDQKLVVPLGHYQRGEEMIPYIEKVARPGMKVLFLTRYLVEGKQWQREEYGMNAVLKLRQIAHQYTWEANLAAAKAQVATACEALRAKGIEAGMEVYAGSLSKAIRSHTSKGDVHSILRCEAVWQRTAGFLSGSDSLLDLFRRPRRIPALLIEVGISA